MTFDLNIQKFPVISRLQTQLPASGFLITAGTIDHILRADLENLPGRPELGLHGGLHTVDAFRGFLKQRPDLDQHFGQRPDHILKYSNGVSILLLPRQAFADSRNRHVAQFKIQGRAVSEAVKALFPSHWTARQILLAIDSVIKDYYALPTLELRRKKEIEVGQGSGLLRIRGVFEGVSIQVSLDPVKGRVMTAHPTLRQPVLSKDFSVL